MEKDIKFWFFEQKFVFSRTRFIEVYRGENSPLGKLTGKVKFHIARAFELFVNNVVHSAARLDEYRRDYRKTAAVFYISRRAEKFLRGL